MSRLKGTEAPPMVCERCRVTLDRLDHYRIVMEVYQHPENSPEDANTHGRLCHGCADIVGEAMFSFAKLCGLSAVHIGKGTTQTCNIPGDKVKP